jgi:hypothetical protein
LLAFSGEVWYSAHMTTTRAQHFPTTLAQIGMGNVLAISGGRWTTTEEGTLVLPVRYGYAVEIDLALNDTYTVRRTFTRSGVRVVKGEATDIYCDMLGDTAYEASCYHESFA